MLRFFFICWQTRN